MDIISGLSLVSSKFCHAHKSLLLKLNPRISHICLNKHYGLRQLVYLPEAINVKTVIEPNTIILLVVNG